MKLQVADRWGGSSMRHGAELRMVSVADDALIAADGGQPGTAVVWTLADGAARVTVKSQTYGLTAAAITPDGSRIAISGYDKRTVVFDGHSGKQLDSCDTRARALAMAFSPDANWLLIGDDRVPRLLSLTGGDHRALKGHLSEVRAVEFSPNGRYAVTAGGDRKIKIQDIGKTKVLATMEGYASTLAFLEDGAHLLYAGFDCGAIVEVPSGKEVRRLDLGFVDSVAVSRDGRRIAVKRSIEKTVVQVLELASGEKVFEREFEPVRLIALDRTGERLVVGRSTTLAQGTSLEVWSVANNERILPRGEGHTGGVVGLATHAAAGRRIAVSASTDRSLKLWDVESGREIETIVGGNELGTLALSPDGRTALTSLGYGRESRMQRWDLDALRVDGELEAGDLGDARALAISPDGRTAAAGFGRRAALFELATGTRRVVLEKHKAQIDAIAFSHDGRYVVTGAADHLVKVWSAETGKELHALAGHTGFVDSLTCLPDGTCISSGGQMFRWELESGQRVAESLRRGEAHALAAAPDGRWLIAIEPTTRRVQLWSLANRSLEGPIDTLELDDFPSAATFAGPTSVLVGTKAGRILRLEIARTT